MKLFTVYISVLLYTYNTHQTCRPNLFATPIAQGLALFTFSHGVCGHLPGHDEAAKPSLNHMTIWKRKHVRVSKHIIAYNNCGPNWLLQTVSSLPAASRGPAAPLVDEVLKVLCVQSTWGDLLFTACWLLGRPVEMQRKRTSSKGLETDGVWEDEDLASTLFSSYEVIFFGETLKGPQYYAFEPSMRTHTTKTHQKPMPHLTILPSKPLEPPLWTAGILD